MYKKIIIGIVVAFVVLGAVGIGVFFSLADKELDSNSITDNNNSSETNKKDTQDNENSNIDNNNNKNETNNGGENMEERKLVLTINNQKLTATLSDNSSVDALVEKLKQSSITIEMSDYANMEKVGTLGFRLPRNDESIATGAGDLILYQGDSFVIYYDHNNWNLTRLGKIDNVSQSEPKKILGNGSVTVVLSLE